MRMNNDNRENNESRECGALTCIHCICDKCMVDKCDFYERFYRQED